ncbi:alpha/beta hydrolase [Achromobacter seleniivolatilans]|uniref:Alpha/beta hydrolase n=1 Tax=Achromobacter seleniivolatilans TaxID=3047478 RepID=A0ABY9M8G3_9BURK|nr:alpha/beta hydrolase [Achromobacter sp. R39]WMD22980.1 alpha/beta hydrolase [Achromobacter sp. R39]
MVNKRRELLFAAMSGAALGWVNPAGAALAAQPADQETLELWPGNRAPQGKGPEGPEKVSAKGSVTQVSRPRLVVYRPAQPNGSAVLVIAGGGYAHIERGTESTPACLWLQAQGVTAFELVYRLPGEHWPPEAPLQDGQRAMRVIRAAAGKFGLDTGRIGIIGFSAGGHLAGMTAATPTVSRYPAVDAADSLSSRPDFAGLIYPVLTFMPPFDHTHARREIVGEHPSAEQSAAYSVDHLVTAQMPPVFLAQAQDDPISPVDNSTLMFSALRKVGVPTEMHIFPEGKHGWGLGQPGTRVHAWPGLFSDWAVFNRFYSM